MIQKVSHLQESHKPLNWSWRSRLPVIGGISCESRESTCLETLNLCELSMTRAKLYTSTMCICLIRWPCLFYIQMPEKILYLAQVYITSSVCSSWNKHKKTHKKRGISTLFASMDLISHYANARQSPSYVNINQLTLQHCVKTLPLFSLLTFF